MQNDQDQTNLQDVPKIMAQKTKDEETDEPEEYVYKLEPAKNYGEPSKNYGEPSKVYSEPAKNYGVPSKVYSEPSKVYSEPAKVYSSDPEPIQQQEISQTVRPHWRYLPSTNSKDASTSVPPRKPIFTDLINVPYDALNAPLEEYPQTKPVQIQHQQTFNDNITSNYQHFQQFINKNLNPQMNYQTTQHPEMNYEIEESVSVMSNGRVHGIQTTTPKTTTVVPQQNQHDSNDNNNNQETPIHSQDAKFGYVVEGINYRKYRVEEKTPDGFIVGEYGVVNNNDGSPIRGVRYTADSNINPRLIYDALLKFLSL